MAYWSVLMNHVFIRHLKSHFSGVVKVILIWQFSFFVYIVFFLFWCFFLCFTHNINYYKIYIFGAKIRNLILIYWLFIININHFFYPFFLQFLIRCLFRFHHFLMIFTFFCSLSLPLHPHLPLLHYHLSYQIITSSIKREMVCCLKLRLPGESQFSFYILNWE